MNSEFLSSLHIGTGLLLWHGLLTSHEAEKAILAKQASEVCSFFFRSFQIGTWLPLWSGLLTSHETEKAILV